MSIKNSFVVAATAASMAFALVAPSFANAAPTIGAPQTAAANYLKQTQDESGLANASLPQLVGRLINIVLGLLGIVFLALAVSAGFQWMTAGGDPKKVDAATTGLKNAVIGLVVIFAAYALTTFIIDNVFLATGGATAGLSPGV